MSNSTSTLDTISSSQASKEVTANAIDDAESPAAFGGRRASTTTALTWGVYGGNYYKVNVQTQAANTTLSLSASNTNYVEFDPVAGTFSTNITSFSDGKVNLYSVVTGASTVSSYTDSRGFALELNKGAPSHIFHTTLSADFTGTNVNTAQPVFNASTNGAITLAASTTYQFEMQLIMTRAAGTTSHTIATLFGGTATLTSIAYQVSATSSTGNVLSAPSSIYATAATATTVTAASTSATENNIIFISGVVRVNAAGTFIPQIQFSAAPGGAPTFLKNSYIKLIPLGSNTVAYYGNWS